MTEAQGLTPAERDALLDDIANDFEAALETDDFINVIEGGTHFQRMLEQLSAVLHAHVVSLVFLDPERRFDMIFSHGANPDFKKWWNQVGTKGGISGLAVDAGKSRWDPDVSRVPEFAPVSDRPTQSQLTLLLRNHGEIQGVLAIEWEHRPSDDYLIVPEPEREEFARRLAMRIFSFRARVFAARSEAAFQAAQQIAELQTTKQRVYGILKAVQQLTGGGEVVVLTRAGSQLRVSQEIDLDLEGEAPPIEIAVRPEHGYVAETAFVRSPFYCGHTENLERYPLYRKVDDSTQCQFTVPLIFRRELVGVLNVGSSQEPYAFNYMTRGLLVQFAAHIAATIYNTTVLDGIRHVYDYVQEQLAVLSIIAPTAIKDRAMGKRSEYLSKFAAMRQHVESVWAGLIPHEFEPDSPAIDSERLDGLRARIQRSVTEALGTAESVFKDSGESFSSEIPKFAALACESAVSAVVQALTPIPYRVDADFSIRREQYDRREFHPWLSHIAEQASVSYLVVKLELTADSTSLGSFPDGNLVNVALRTRQDEEAPIREMGITLWASDRALAATGGFLSALKTDPGTVQLSFWFLEESTRAGAAVAG